MLNWKNFWDPRSGTLIFISTVEQKYISHNRVRMTDSDTTFDSDDSEVGVMTVTERPSHFVQIETMFFKLHRKHQQLQSRQPRIVNSEDYQESEYFWIRLNICCCMSNILWIFLIITFILAISDTSNNNYYSVEKDVQFEDSCHFHIKTMNQDINSISSDILVPLLVGIIVIHIISMFSIYWIYCKRNNICCGNDNDNDTDSDSDNGNECIDRLRRLSSKCKCKCKDKCKYEYFINGSEVIAIATGIGIVFWQYIFYKELNESCYQFGIKYCYTMDNESYMFDCLSLAIGGWVVFWGITVTTFGFRRFRGGDGIIIGDNININSSGNDNSVYRNLSVVIQVLIVTTGIIIMIIASNWSYCDESQLNWVSTCDPECEEIKRIDVEWNQVTPTDIYTQMQGILRIFLGISITGLVIILCIVALFTLK